MNTSAGTRKFRSISRIFPTLVGVISVGFAANQASQAHEGIAGFTVNAQSRADVRDFYNALYPASLGMDLEWSGSYENNSPGTVSHEFKDATIARINFFRALAGVPANIQLDDTLSAKAQEAALMMSVKGQLSHNPGTEDPLDPIEAWPYWTEAGHEAAGKANLFMGTDTLDPVGGAIDGYIADYGPGNQLVGHRRWLLYPQTKTMGVGHVPGSEPILQANAVWVIEDGTFFDTRPPVRDGFIAWPPPGFMPYQLVYPRWSLSYAGGDFSDASVAVTQDGQPINAQLESKSSGAGEPTIVWGMPNWSDFQHAPKVGSDTTYQVTVSNVKFGGSVSNFTYNVTLFDPAIAGPDSVTPNLAGPAAPFIGKPNDYTATRPAAASGLEIRTFRRETLTVEAGAEGGIGELTLNGPEGFPGINTQFRSTGSASYWLGHSVPPVDTATLSLPQTILVRSNTKFGFKSRHGISTPAQTARLQISADGGVSWKDHFADTGAQTAEIRFSNVDIDLAEYVGREIQIRFAYTLDPGAYLSVMQNGVLNNTIGWYIDDISLTNAEQLSQPVVTSVPAQDVVQITPETAGTQSIQARALLFGKYPLGWGPLLDIAPVQPAIPAAARITSIHVGGNDSVTLDFDAVVGEGVRVRVESSAQFEGSWHREETVPQGVGEGKFRVNVNGTAETKRFFRVVSF